MGWSGGCRKELVAQRIYARNRSAISRSINSSTVRSLNEVIATRLAHSTRDDGAVCLSAGENVSWIELKDTTWIKACDDITVSLS